MKRLPIREIIFGLEDSIVSTLGVVIGMATGTNDRYVVILSAIVVIAVESISMTAGTYLSSKSQREVTHATGGIIRRSINDSLYMGVFYILGGFIAILPFFFLHPMTAITPSIIISVATLFIIGYLKGWFAGTNRLRGGLEMSLVSISAAALGYLIGIFAKTALA